MKTFKAEGIVIKRRNFGEADKILTVFTKSTGKIQIKAVGVRRIPSRRSAHVELLNHSMLNLYKGRNNPILTEAQTIENFSSVKDNLTSIGHAYHVCELVDGLCPENQENIKVFYLLKNILTNLAMQSADKELVRLHDKASTEDNNVNTNNPRKNVTWPLKVRDGSVSGSYVRQFEFDLLSMLGYWNSSATATQNFDTRQYIENILERKLKSQDIFERLQ